MSLLPLTDRLYDYSSIYNFRDFGGYAGAGGKPVKTGCLFRSAHLNRLSDKDLTAIGGLDIGLIVDLRHAPERKRQPSRLYDPAPQIFEYQDGPKTEGHAPHEAFIEKDLNTAADSHRYMMNSYAARPHDKGFQKIFAQTLQHLIADKGDGREGVLVHCAAGKDRTGTLVALIQALLGVSRDDILADYMLTMQAVNIDPILKPAAANYTKIHGREINPEALRPMFGVAPEFIDIALEKMGPATDYAAETLSFTGDDIDVLRQKYLTA